MATRIVGLPTGVLSIDDVIGMPLAMAERLIIERTLERYKGNRTHAAKVLGICNRTLRSKLKKYKSADSLNQAIAA